MFTLDTEILTSNGLIEAWKIFPGDELLDSNSKAYEITDMYEAKETTCLLTLEDETQLQASKSFLLKQNIRTGKNLILDKPISIIELENNRPDYQPVLPVDGLDFGNYGKYNSIPFYYTMNTVENRKAFLQGLLFSQLVVSNNDMNEVILLVSNNEFAENILYLVRSLGGTGYYYMFYSKQEYFEVTINLPVYFKEGIPTRKITKIETIEEKDLLYFQSAQKDFVVNQFIVIPNNKGETNEQENFN